MTDNSRDYWHYLRCCFQWRHAHGVRGGPGPPPQIFSKDEKLFLYKNILHT